MTRRGSTPFLQTVFKAALVVFAAKPGAVPDWEEIERKETAGDSWEDWRVYFGELREQGYDRVRLSVSSAGDTGLEAYLAGPGEGEKLVFGFGIVSSDTRQRRFKAGEITPHSAGKFIASGSLDLDLAGLRGEVRVEPMIIAAADLPGPKGWLAVTKGTIVGTTHMIRLREFAPVGPLGDIFKYEWISFSEADKVSPGEWFDIDLLAPGERPVLYLNEDIQNFHHLMNVKDPTMGKPSAKVKSRRTMDSTLAVEVMTAALATVVHRIADIAAQRRLEDPNEDEFGSIFDELSTHEQTIAEGWRHLLGTGVDHRDGPSVCSEIGAMNSGDLLTHLSSVMPRRIRAQAGMESAAEHIIAGGLRPESTEEGA